MTTFSITGLRGGERVTVTWTDGALAGDESAIAAVIRLADEYVGRPLKPVVGPITTEDHLSSPYSACLLMRSVFKPGTTSQTGHLPLLDMPPGAIH